MKIVKFSYKGDKWLAYLIPTDEMASFVDDLDDATAAQIEWEKREMYISEDELKLHTILHELFHMARGYNYVDSCSLTDDQMEELCCELFAYEGEYILKLGKEILKTFHKLQKIKEDEMEIVLTNE